ncbi:hypothetical protein [Pseudarthrobacter sp. SSS035]|uniref:hypothetical protein n=1 Tax=Pseudarthrobacter sp. SSS035 TaxID=2931399 RepID=UPI00200C9C83|nr:hypothetical protein [Pseudarthrobacter sp. SSS035]
MGKFGRFWFIGMSAVLAGCSVEPASIAESERQGGLPPDAITAKPGSSAQSPLYPFPQAGWLDAGAKFAVVLGGSSSCPAFPSSIEVVDAHHLTLGIDTRGGPNCTADLAPRTYIIRTPNEVDVSREVTLQYGKTTVVLPPL